LTEKSEQLENELKELIIDALKLEDVTVEDIVTDEPLFYDGLGLDSLDALELGVAISKKYNIKLINDPEGNRKIFASVKAMAEYIIEQGTSKE
jgi:acyl carrier protein